MQLSTIRSRVRALANIRSSSILPDADIDEYVNDFTKMLCESYDWPQLVGSNTYTASQSATFSYAADARTIIAVAVRTPDGVKLLSQIGSREADLRRSSEVAAPAYYFDDVATRRIVVIPQPPAGTVIEVKFHKNPPTLVQASDVPPFDPEYHLAWATAAAATALRERSGDPQKAQYFEAKTGEVISRMRRRYLMSRDREPMHLPKRW